MEWIKVSEQLPETGKDVLVTDGEAQMVATIRTNGTFDFWYNSKFWEHENVTHWMPLPNLPHP